MPKKMSLKQIEANRQNARKSTGPKTSAGRAASKMNTLKHGVLSQKVLVRGRNRPESSAELKALQARLWEGLNGKSVFAKRNLLEFNRNKPDPPATNLQKFLTVFRIALACRQH